ncbi:MAG TPA: glucose 1-dehydrogenase [Planctomycetes bacterium]|nr:glucose 1-dehydrogenase [Planctomycetota bacterium]
MAVEINLAGRRALVTGAGRGIGRAIALKLASAGAEVVLAARSLPELERVAAEIKALGYRAHVHPVDVSDVRGIPAFFETAAAAAGTIDILVNNAGINLRSPAEETDFDAWDKVMRVNLDAVFFLSQAFFKHLKAAGRTGKIVNIASLLSEAARPTIAPYTASKGGIRQLTLALAVEWAKYGVTVNAVGPGYIATEMTEPLRNDPEFNAWVLERTPLKRWGAPEDVASAVLFLVSEHAGFITGQVIYVDGGWLASL